MLVSFSSKTNAQIYWMKLTFVKFITDMVNLHVKCDIKRDKIFDIFFHRSEIDVNAEKDVLFTKHVSVLW